MHQTRHVIDMITKNSDTLKVRVWVAPPGKSPRATEALPLLVEYVAEQIQAEYQLQLGDQLQHHEL